MARERDRRDAEGSLTLRWPPGEAQVDFGEADFRVRGMTVRGKCLTVSFPHSNVGLTQVFWGETAECVCQGLRNVFEFVGGVPRGAVFDNATEVGRRVGGEARASELFRRLAAHYGLDYAFTNPRSGNEKGSVENKVGCHRRNLFVPVPSFHDVRAFNRRLPDDRLGLSEGKRHYRLGTPESELFGEGRGRSRRCRRPRSRARGGRPGGAAGRARSPSAGCAAARPAPPARAARSLSRSAPSTSRPAAARPGRSSPPMSASGARPPPTARTRRCS